MVTLSLLDVLGIVAALPVALTVMWCAGAVAASVFAAVLSLIDPSDGGGS